MRSTRIKKRAQKIYHRDPKKGFYYLGAEGEKIIIIFKKKEIEAVVLHIQTSIKGIHAIHTN